MSERSAQVLWFDDVGRADVSCVGDKNASLMFSIEVLINAAWGMGENVVQGTVDPDEYEVFKSCCPIHR